MLASVEQRLTAGGRFLSASGSKRWHQCSAGTAGSCHGKSGSCRARITHTQFQRFSFDDLSAQAMWQQLSLYCGQITLHCMARGVGVRLPCVCKPNIPSCSTGRCLSSWHAPGRADHPALRQYPGICTGPYTLQTGLQAGRPLGCKASLSRERLGDIMMNYNRQRKSRRGAAQRGHNIGSARSKQRVKESCIENGAWELLELGMGTLSHVALLWVRSVRAVCMCVCHTIIILQLHSFGRPVMAGRAVRIVGGRNLLLRCIDIHSLGLPYLQPGGTLVGAE